MTMHTIIQGIIAGLIMGGFAMIMNMLKVTTLNLTEYMGCMLTSRKSGITSLAAGFGLHIIASAMFAIIYVNIVAHFQLAMNVHTTLILAVGHTLIAGTLLGSMDKINQCVRAKKVKAMGMFGSEHGTAGIVVYVTAHVLYTALTMYLLGAHSI